MCAHKLTTLTFLLGVALTHTAGNNGNAAPFTRIITTRYGKLQGVVKRLNENGAYKHLKPIEMYLGVPYATSPTGPNRFSPTRTPEPWDGIKFVGKFSPVCPQKLPHLGDAAKAMERMPRGRYEHLKRLLPHLQNQSEDCLYLNIFTPLQETGPPLQKYPVLIYIHGESFEWNSGNPYDGRILASYADFVVITLNYRLGVLGFLNANAAPHLKARVANYGLMDQIAALHWVQQNIGLFGGDPGNVTMMGHGTGAACINFLMISPTVMPGLFHKAVLLSGSALSSWALVEDPVHYAIKLASQVNCSVPDDIYADHESIVDCLRDVPLGKLMSADTSAPTFLSGFGPSVDGVVIKVNFQQELLLNILPELQGYSAGSIALGTPINIKKNSEILLGGTNKYDLLFGVVTSEALPAFSHADIEGGFEGERRDKIIRTYIRNAYMYHLSEIFFTVINEYTDWERTVLHPINTRDATIAAMSDAQYVAPLVQIGDLLSRPQLISGGGANASSEGQATPSSSSSGHTKSFFYVFDYQTKDGDYPQRMGTAHGEELPYIFGAPLIDGFSHFPRNFTKSEVALSEAFILYLSNFARNGNPNEFQHRAEMTLAGSKEKNRFRSISWDEYDPVHQKYLEISMKPRMKNHYRAHQLSVWLRLIPELHRAGMEGGEGGAYSRHNVFRVQEGAELYEGVVRADPLGAGRRHSVTSHNGTVAEIIQQPIITSSMPSHQLTSCLNLTQPSQHQNLHPPYHELSSLDLSNFASYNTALTITITIGCSLLVLNILIFAGVYYQKDRNNSSSNCRKKDRSKRKNSLSNSNSSCYDSSTNKNILNMDTSSIIVDIERDMMLTEDKQQHCDLMLSHAQSSSNNSVASMKTLSHLATLPRKHIMSDTQCVTSLNTQYNAMSSQCCNNVATLPRNITFNPVMTYDCKLAQSQDCNFRGSPNLLDCSRAPPNVYSGGNPCDSHPQAKNLIKLNSSTSSSSGSAGSNPPGGNLNEMRV